MTTRSRVRWAGAVATVAALVVAAAPAAAAPPAIRILAVSSDHVKSGGSVRVQFRATNSNQRAATVFVAVSGGLRCTTGCSATRNLKPGRSHTFTATLVAPKVSPGEESGRNLAVSVRVGTETAFDHKMIIVGGTAEPAAAVRQVSGRVRDAGGKAVRGVELSIKDSAGHEYRATTGGSGRFSIRSSTGRPIATGAIAVVAAKDGYGTARATVRGTAGGSTTVRLTLTAVAAPARTSPSPTAKASSPASAEEPETRASFAAAPTRTTDDDGNGTLVFTVLGGLLVAAGVGTLVLMALRRRNSPEAGGMADAPTAVLRTVPPDGGVYGRPVR